MIDHKRLDAMVVRGMERARAGDDEALNALVLEIRPWLSRLVPAYLQAVAREGGSRWLPPLDEGVREGVIALHESLILWQPAQQHFAECLDSRLRMRLVALMFRLKDLKRRVEEVPV